MHRRLDPLCRYWHVPCTRFGWWLIERNVRRGRLCLPCVTATIDADRQRRWNDGASCCG